MNVIEASDICLKIGQNNILNNVSLNIKEGDIHALIGFNGAGKTSLLRILLGLTPVYSGKISFFGTEDIQRQRMLIGSVMDSVKPDEYLSAAGYLHRICCMFGTQNAAFERELLKKTGLADTGRKHIGRFSLGMVRRLMIACALATNPKLLILDEPFNGIDPQGMNEMRRILHELNSSSVTILITSHHIPELLKTANTFTIMSRGETVDTFTSEQLSQMHFDKTVVYPSDINAFMAWTEQTVPEMFVVSEANNSVAIFGANASQVADVLAGSGQLKNDIIETKKLSEEDILLWKMNGNHGQDISEQLYCGL